MRGRMNPALSATLGTLVALGLSLAAPAFADDEDCLACHAPEEEVVEADYQVEPDGWMGSIHAEMGFTCTECHLGNFEEFPHEVEDEPSCLMCHEDAAEDLAVSVHGHSMQTNEATPFEGQGCGNCHGIHDVKAVDDPQSRVWFRNIPDTCDKCHGDIDVVQANDLSRAPADNYSSSVHGLKLNDPDAQPAVCTSCHGHHAIRPARDPQSRINPFNIPDTCGQCHEQISEVYLTSVHGEAHQHGVTLAPTCTSCHGMHNIAPVTRVEGADLDDVRIVRTTCPACHESAALMREYDVPAARVESYRASFHGLVHRRGEEAVADCASCHGVHNIYSSEDPRSTVAPQNLEETCGSCHPGAGVEFVKSPVHAETASEQEATIVMWVKRIYWVLLFSVLGGMVVHNAVILVYYMRRKWRKENAEAARVRFDRGQVIQHFVLVFTFFLLVISGFMLAYPDTWWSQGLAGMGVTESIRRWVHRIAAIGMTAASIYHIGWILFTPYGRSELKRIAPGLRDVREVIQNMRFHLGSSELPAAFAKYDYPAKAEYWALVWGTVVMVITGAILWFPVIATSFMPGWIVQVATVVHLFEAWLATLAILIFHFFYVIFHPEVYPLSFAMIRGTMPAKQAEHHHPGWSPAEDADAKTA